MQKELLNNEKNFYFSCGVNKSLDYSKNLQNRCLNVSHRHIVWTIPDTLRNIFRKNRNALDLLFLASKITIFSIFKNKFTPGIISTLHTFGRDLKWNPHIHMLVTEGGFDLNKNYLELKHFSYTKLRKTFMTVLLKLLYNNKYISLNEKQIQYILYKNGYYIYAPKTASFNTSQKLLSYITKYISRPVIASSRIINYDGENVTYFFERHEDNKKITVTENALDFIGKLIIHIPNEYKNLIRYYGIYAYTKVKKERLLRRKEKRTNKLKWKAKIEYYFKINPLKCNKCKFGILKFELLYLPKKQLKNYII